MVIKGVKKTNNSKYCQVRQRIEDDGQVIKAICSNESAFVRKNNDKFVFPTVTIDSVRVSKAEKQNVEAMLIDISNNINTDFIQECLDVLDEGKNHTTMVQNKIDSIIAKNKTKSAFQSEQETHQIIEEQESNPAQSLQQKIDEGAIDNIENTVPEKPKELKIKEKNPLDVVYDGMEDDINAKTVGNMDDLSSYEVSYV